MQIDEKKLIKQILNDIRVEAAEEFDRNFERKGFFEKGKWKHAQYPTNRGSLMLRSGKLRRSIAAEIKGNSVVFTSSEPYAAIHNEGGEIVVTEKMKRFFWAKYYELSSKVRTNKSGKKSASAASQRSSAQAEYYKGLALMKTGAKIKIPQRQFIGDHPKLRELLEKTVYQRIESFFNDYFNGVQNKIK